MDLGLHLRVLWRFRILVVLGVLLALTLATLSMMRLNVEDGSLALAYRQSEEYLSISRLQVTQAGFPEGRSVFPQGDLSNPGSNLGPSPLPFADPSRFNQLAVYYSQLANSDEVQRMVYEEGPLEGSVSAQAAGDPLNRGDVLPFINFAGVATDPATAQKAARRGAEAFTRFLSERQRAARIPESERVLLKPVQEPQLGLLVAERKKTRPIATFLAVVIVFVGLAFILENLRPSAKSVSALEDRGGSMAA